MSLYRQIFWNGRPSIGEVQISDNTYSWNVIPLDEPERFTPFWKWIRKVPASEVELAPIQGIMNGTKVRVGKGHYQYAGYFGVVVGLHQTPGYVNVERVNIVNGTHRQGWGAFAAEISYLEELPQEPNRIEWEIQGKKGKVHLDWPWLVEMYDRFRWVPDNPPTIELEADGLYRVRWMYFNPRLRGIPGVINSAEYDYHHDGLVVEVDDLDAFLKFPTPYLKRAETYYVPDPPRQEKRENSQTPREITARFTYVATEGGVYCIDQETGKRIVPAKNWPANLPTPELDDKWRGTLEEFPRFLVFHPIRPVLRKQDWFESRLEAATGRVDPYSCITEFPTSWRVYHKNEPDKLIVAVGPGRGGYSLYYVAYYAEDDKEKIIYLDNSCIIFETTQEQPAIIGGLNDQTLAVYRWERRRVNRVLLRRITDLNPAYAQEHAQTLQHLTEETWRLEEANCLSNILSALKRGETPTPEEIARREKERLASLRASQQ